MARYTLKRFLQIIPVLIGVSFLVFLLLYLSPGDPARMVLGDNATVEQIDEFHARYDLDKPLLIQYGKYMWNIVTKGDFLGFLTARAGLLQRRSWNGFQKLLYLRFL